MADPLLLGANLTAAQAQLDLFTWFQFRETIRHPLREADGLRTIDFKPTGPAFRELVTLQLTTDADDIIRRAWLVVDRAFIDDPARGLHAADLVKSYLNYAHVGRVDPVIAALGSEIVVRSTMRARTVVITGAKLPEVPVQPSPGYLAYAGERDNELIVHATDGTHVALHASARPPRRFLGLILMNGTMAPSA